MTQDGHEMLELLKFELKFVEDGGYGRCPRTPWRPPYILEDSPSCPNLGDPARPHPCNECRLIKFVPSELRSESSPCRFIPLNEKGQTIDYFYRCGTQLEMEEALAGWLRSEITRIEQQLAKLTDPLLEARVEFSKLAEAKGNRLPVGSRRVACSKRRHSGVHDFLQGRFITND